MINCGALESKPNRFQEGILVFQTSYLLSQGMDFKTAGKSQVNVCFLWRKVHAPSCSHFWANKNATDWSVLAVHRPILGHLPIPCPQRTGMIVVCPALGRGTLSMMFQASDFFSRVQSDIFLSSRPGHIICRTFRQQEEFADLNVNGLMALSPKAKCDTTGHGGGCKSLEPEVVCPTCIVVFSIIRKNNYG